MLKRLYLKWIIGHCKHVCLWCEYKGECCRDEMDALVEKYTWKQMRKLKKSRKIKEGQELFPTPLIISITIGTSRQASNNRKIDMALSSKCAYSTQFNDVNDSRYLV